MHFKIAKRIAWPWQKKIGGGGIKKVIKIDSFCKKKGLSKSFTS